MTEAPKLKPCPFCGASDPSDVYVDRLQSDGRRWAVLCTATDCLVEGPHRATKREAIAAWNTRDDAEVQRLVAEAREEAFEEAAALLDKHHSAPIGPADHWSSEYADAHCDGQVDAAASWKRAIRALSDATPRQVTPQEAAKVLLKGGSYADFAPAFSAMDARWEDGPEAAFSAALRALANGGDSDG